MVITRSYKAIEAKIFYQKLLKASSRFAVSGL
jgi:hypothetical protein